MDKGRLTKKIKNLFLGNTFEGYSDWKNINYKFVAPANKEHTFQWLWDTGFHAIHHSNHVPCSVLNATSEG